MTDEAGRAETRADAALPGAGETGRQAAKAARRAEKAARKAGQRKAEKAARRAEKAARRAEKAARKAGQRKAEKAAHKAEKAARKAERSARRAQGAGDSDAAGQSASMVGRPVRPTRQEREVAAEAVLAQVADLVRRGGDPAVGPSEASAGAPPTGPTSAALPVPLVVVPPGAAISASVDVGANSVHLLVAALDDDRLIPLADESVFLGLGDRVSAHGFLGPDARERLAAALETYADKARALGAREVTVVGTEPLRRAADAAAALRDVERRTGLSVRVLDHHEEGTLTLLGVSMGRPVSAELLVLDIGGGSSEIVVAAPGRPVVTVGLRIGSARLTQDHVANDPPLLAEVDAMRDEARLVVAGAPPASPAELVVVGGTATNLVRLAPQALEDRLLGRDRIATALALLTEERSEVTAERHAVRPERARTLAAGAVILDAILERYHARRIRVSDAGVREGTIVAVALGHIGWRDSLETLATG